MAIKKVLENGKNKYEVIVKVRDKSGKQVMRRKRWFASEREARKVEIDILMELEGFKTKVTWKKWVEYVLEKYRVEYRNSTYQNYKHMISKWFTPKWGELFLDEIKPADVHEIVFDPKAQISSYTRKTLLKIVKRFLNVALEEAVIVRNPAIGIKVRIVEANQEVLRVYRTHSKRSYLSHL